MDRFQRTKFATNLIELQKKEFEKSMEYYLKALDTRVIIIIYCYYYYYYYFDLDFDFD